MEDFRKIQHIFSRTYFKPQHCILHPILIKHEMCLMHMFHNKMMPESPTDIFRVILVYSAFNCQMISDCDHNICMKLRSTRSENSQKLSGKHLILQGGYYIVACGEGTNYNNHLVLIGLNFQLSPHTISFLRTKKTQFKSVSLTKSSEIPLYFYLHLFLSATF